MARKNLKVLDAKKGKLDVSAIRNMTPEERRMSMIKAFAEAKPTDYEVLNSEVAEERVPTGSIVLDHVLGLEGIPFRGRVIMIHGAEYAHKSTLATCMAAAYQQTTGCPVVIQDYERTATAEYYQKVKLNLGLSSAAKVFFPKSIVEGGRDIIKYMIAGCRFFICDSIPRMQPEIASKEALSGEAFKPTSYGRHAKAIANFFDVVLPYAHQFDATIIMINQHRARIEATQEATNAQKYPSYTNLPYNLPGGLAARYVPSIVLENKMVRAFTSEALNKEDAFLAAPVDNDANEHMVYQIRCRVLKNKVTGAGYRKHDLWFRPGRGLDNNISIRQLARTLGLITNKGAKWLVGNPEAPIAVFENKEAAVKSLVVNEDPELLHSLAELIVKEVAADSAEFRYTISEEEQDYVSGTVDMKAKYNYDEEAAEDINFSNKEALDDEE